MLNWPYNQQNFKENKMNTTTELTVSKMTDEEYQAKYGTMWETQKKSDEFYALPVEEQARIREAQLLAFEESKTAIAKIKAYADLDEIKKRFINMLGDHDAKVYIESIIIAVSNNAKLQECTPKSIMIQAMRAASLHLSVDPIMKQAHLVPFGKEATLIIDYHGLVQMTTNTGYYEIAPNVFEIFEGEEIKLERFSGKITIEGKRTGDSVIGWCGYFKGKNGSERYLYMTNEECDAHGQKYSRGYEYKDKSGNFTSLWHKEAEKMRRKTVLRLLVSRWGNFSPMVTKILLSDEIVDVDSSDLPSDENIIIPDTDDQAPEHRKSAEENLIQLGFIG